MATLTHRLEELVEHLIKELLALHVAQSTTTIVILQLVKVLIVRPELREVLVAGERIKISKDSIALHVSRVVQVDMLRIGVHRAHLLPHLIGRVREVDAVAKRLRHLLLTVSTRQSAGRQVLGQHDVRLYEHLSVGLIEATYEFTRHLKHRLLILTYGNGGRFEKRDVGSLRNGIAEESEGHALALEATHLDLCLHRRVALNATHRDKVHQIGSELCQLRDLALDEEYALLRIKPGGKVVESHLDDVLAYLFRIVGIIGKSLHIGHKHEHTIIVALILQLDTTAQRADVVSQVKFSGGAVTGQNNFSHI